MSKFKKKWLDQFPVCYNKLPQIWWIETLEVCSLTVLETRNLKLVSLSQKSRCQQSCTPGGPRAESVPHLFQLLVPPGTPWLMATWLCSPSHCHLLCPLSDLRLSLEGYMWWMALRAHPGSSGVSPHLNILNHTKTLFLPKVMFTGSRLVTRVFWGQPYFSLSH